MKLHLSTADLLDAVRTVSGAVSSRTTLPILSHLLFTTADGTAWLAGSNLDTSIRCQIPVRGSRESAALAFPARRAAQVLASFAHPDTLVEWEGPGKNVRLLNGGGAYQLATMPAEDFPVIKPLVVTDATTAHGAFSLTAAKLQEVIRHCKHAVSDDPSRAVLMNLAVFLAPPDSITLVATDGRRLVECQTVANLAHVHPASGSAGHCLLIPSFVLALAARLGEGDDLVSFKFDEARVELRCGRDEIIAKLSEGTYPNYKQVIPANWVETVLIRRKELSEAISQLGHIVTDKENGITVTPGAGETLILEARSVDGWGSVTVECSGKATIKTNLRHEYLRQLVDSQSSDHVRLSLIGGREPVRLQPDNAAASGILMPMVVE